MGEGDAVALADGAEDVDLALVLADLAGGGLGIAVGGAGLRLRRAGVSIDGVAHGLAVDGDGVVGVAAGGVEAPQGAVELVGVDAYQNVADDVFAGHLVAAAAVPATEPLAGARRQVGGPFGHGLVAARAAQRGAGGDGEHDGQRMAPALAAARVVDVGEVVGQGTHGVGGDHGLQASVAVDGVECGPGQARPRGGDQGADEDQLRRGRGGAVAAAQATEAARAPDAGPVRGAVHRAAEARRIDEGLQQHERVAEARRPVRRQPPFAQRQHPRAQIRHAPARQDQEAAIVGEQVLAVVLRAKVPTDPAVAGAALQRRRREADQRHPPVAPARGVPQRFADLRRRPQVVVRRHQLPITPFRRRRHRLHGNLAQLHSAPGSASNCGRFYTGSARMSSIPPNPFFPLAFPGWTNSPWATFSESVTVTGTPQVALTIGAATRMAGYSSGSPGTQLVFQYTVTTTDEDPDGASIQANGLDAGGGAVQKTGSSVDANLAHAARTNQSNHKVDGVPPDFASLTAVGNRIVLTLGEPLDVSPKPAPEDFTVTVDGTPRDVTAVSVSGSTVTLTLDSAVSAGEAVAITYAGTGTHPIRDAAQNTAPTLSSRAVRDQTANVCDRTAQVRDAIVARTSVSACADVTAAHLAAITWLNLGYESISELDSGDFSGLTALTSLFLNNNNLTSLPDGLLAGLDALEWLWLHDNALTSLPANAVSGSPALLWLQLNDNELDSLDAALFAGLTALEELDLSGNALDTLPAGIFSDLSALTFPQPGR